MPDGAPAATHAKETTHKQQPAPQVPVALTDSALPLTLGVQRAILNPSLAGPGDILALQRTVGNRTVSQLLATATPKPSSPAIQTKLTVGPVGDRYEQEADRVADQILSMPLPSSSANGVPAKPQRQAEDEEEIQTKPLLQRQEDEEEVQTKPLAQRQAEDEEEIQTKPLLRRQEDEEEIQTKPIVQRQADGGFEAGVGLERRLLAHKGGGRPLADDVRTYMEPRFGVDFSQVRVHTGGEAGQLARELKAQAFTHGQDIYLGEGRYDPGTTAGKRLLAHELTHTIQQTGVQTRLAPTSQLKARRVQRYTALATKDTPTYEADGNKVKSGKLFGKKSTGQKIPRYSVYGVADQPAENARDYRKVQATGPKFDGQFVQGPVLVAPTRAVRVANCSTNIKNGVKQEPVLYGDILDISGSAYDYYIAKDRRNEPGATQGSINKDKVTDYGNGLDIAGDPSQAHVALKLTSVHWGWDTLAHDRAKSVGVSAGKIADIRPGDKLKLDLQARGLDWAGKTHWAYAQRNGTKGYLNLVAGEDIVQQPSPRMRAAGNPRTMAATTAPDVPLYEPADADRDKSIGIKGEIERFKRSGTTLEADFGATGINARGEEKLIYARSFNNTGYVERDKIRNVQDTTRQLERQFGSPQGGRGGQPQLENVTQDVIVRQKTALRQQKGTGNTTSLHKTYQMNPGVILGHTDNSRFLPFLEGRAWYTEMLYEGDVLGFVDKDKSESLEPAHQAKLKLGTYRSQDLKRVRVKEETQLREIVGRREHTIEIGNKISGALKADDIVKVDFSIRGVDEQFSFGWVYAQDEMGREGYIREEKVTQEGTEGKVKTTSLGGAQVEGNEIPQANKYVATGDSNDDAGVQVGDRFDPTRDAVATQEWYWGLKNLRTGGSWKVRKSAVILASDALTKAPAQPRMPGIITQKTALRRAKYIDRQKNVGIEKEGIVELTPGDRVQVDFEAGGVYAGGDIDWLYANYKGRQGYVRAAKVRESSAELLKEASRRGTVPDLDVPAYVIRKTKLRDEKKRTKETVTTGELIQVNFAKHPPTQVRQAGSQAMTPTPYHGDSDRWVQVKVQGQSAARYIREHKVTAKALAFKHDAPEGGGLPGGKGLAYEAAKMLLTGVKETAFESIGGWGVGTTSDIYKGAEGLGWTGDGRPLEHVLPDPDTAGKGSSLGHETYGQAIAGGIGAVMGLLGAVEGLRQVFGSGKGIKDRLLGLLKAGESGLKGVIAGARLGESIHKLKDNTSGADLADKVAGWSAGIANAISALKGLFLSIYSLFSSKNHKKNLDKFGDLAKSTLEAGQAGVKAARFFTKLAGSPATNQLAITVPIIGLAIDIADIVLGFRKWLVGMRNQLLAVAAQKTQSGQEIKNVKKREINISRVAWQQNKLLQAVVGKIRASNAELPPDFLEQPHVSEGNKFKSQLFWKEKRGIRSLSTSYRKRRYFRINPKILFAIRNKEKLDERAQDGTLKKRSREFASPDYYVVVDVAGKHLYAVVLIGGKPVKILAETERAIGEYEFASKVEEVSKKKKTLGLEGIETGFVNLVGDALGISGVTATAGAITKGVMTAINAGFDFGRFINRQWDTRQGKKFATALKYKGQIMGVDKSQMQKQREYYEHACFIMEEIGQLASPTEILKAAQEGKVPAYQAQYRRVQQYIDMTGVHTTLFYAYNGKPDKQVELLVESLSER